MVCFINHDFTLVRDDEADKSLKEFMCSDAVKNYPYPALVDADKAKSLLSGTSEKNYDDVLALSRFSFMGTDGMRGKVSLDEMDDRKAFFEYTTNNLITRPLIKAASHAFARMC